MQAKANPGLLTGTLVDWKKRKGFGFIRPDNGGPDVFCHVANLAEGVTEESFRNGDVMEFVIATDDKRGGEPQAEEIRPAGGGRLKGTIVERTKKKGYLGCK